MLDFDLAEMYQVETRILNQSVKRNQSRFPEDFMFQLTNEEWEDMSSQFVMTSRAKRPKSALPLAFTEHGVVMLSSILRSDIAIQTSVLIVRAFVAIRQLIAKFPVDRVGRRICALPIPLGKLFELLVRVPTPDTALPTLVSQANCLCLRRL